MDEHAVRLNTGRQGLRLFLGMAVLLGLTAYFVVAAVSADRTATRVAATVFGAVFAVVAVAVGVGGAFALTRRTLVADPEGLRLDGGRQPWRLRWADVRSISVQSGYTLAGQSAAVPARLRRVRTVRLLVELHDLSGPGPLPPKVYRGRWGASKTGFGIPLGPVRELLAPLDAALRATAAGRYAGVVDLGRVRGLL